VLNVIVGPPGIPYVKKVVTETTPGEGCIGPITSTFTYGGVRHAWSWRAHVEPDEAIATIEIGPASSLEKKRPRASFRWSEGNGRYVGPIGSRAQGFRQIPPTNPFAEIANFVGQAIGE
jgi:hypothetical protein